MVNRKAVLALVALAVCLFALGWFNGAIGGQQRPAPSLQGVEIVTYPSGLTGFLERDTGTLYIYDARWEKCVKVCRLNRLGDPMTDVTPSP